MDRVNIGFFGCRNVGKSSLVNAVTNQEMSVVSDVKGTTTDAVKKTMELLPIGPVVIIDTPGFDDEGSLGEKRIEATKKILRSCDIAILVAVAGEKFNSVEKELISIFKQREVPYIIVKNKIDTIVDKEFQTTDLDIQNSENIVCTSATKNIGIEELKNTIGKLVNNKSNRVRLIGDLIKPNDIVLLVTPIDSSAPKGRLILPQQMAIRDILDSNAVAIVTKETELQNTFNSLTKSPAVVITDSQVFGKVKNIVPKDIPLTSFSILMARYKGFLNTAVNGAKKIGELQNNSRVLICEGCTHHRQCDDIGTVKLPKWIKDYTAKELIFEWNSGTDFPQDLSKYDLVIHCGGCMLNENEMKYRMNVAKEQKISFTNYGTAIAYMQGILERSIEPIPDLFKDK